MDHDREQTEGREEYEWVKNEYLHKVVIAIALIFIVAFLLLVSLFYFVAKTPLKDVVFLFLIDTVICWPIILYVTSKAPHYIAISENGIHFRDKKGNERLIKWEEIKDISLANGSRYGRRWISYMDDKRTNLGYIDYRLAKEIQTRHKEKTMLNSK